MWWYVAKRLLQTIPVFLGATLILFLLLQLRPGDPILNLAGNKPVSQEVRDALAAQYHLDDPWYVQYILFVKNSVTLDFGETFAGQPVFDLIKQTFPVTVVARRHGAGVRRGPRHRPRHDCRAQAATASSTPRCSWSSLALLSRPDLRGRLRDAAGVRGEARTGPSPPWERTGRFPD